jgi:hypothetical protein
MDWFNQAKIVVFNASSDIGRNAWYYNGGGKVRQNWGCNTIELINITILGNI